MANYSERVDERSSKIIDRVYLFGVNGGLGYRKFENELSPKDAKQAITSLIKELVAEVKPAMAIIYDNEMRIDRARKSAANHATDQFEQNLLKALKERGE